MPVSLLPTVLNEYVMASEDVPIGRSYAIYFGVMIALAASIILALYVLFVSRMPAFSNAFVRNPPGAIQTYPFTALGVLAVLFAIVLLFGLVIGFGARVALPERDVTGENESR